jgi:NitT/TauT family transport system substrate-binding protein
MTTECVVDRSLKEEAELIRKKVSIGAAMVLATLAATTACAPSNPRANGSAGDEPAGPNTVRVGLLGIMSDAPIAIAQERGYFDKFDVDLQIQEFDSGGDMVAPMASGDLDVGGGAFSAGLMNSIADGNGMEIVADKGAFPTPELGSQQFIVAKHAADQIKELSDLKGRKIAIGTAEGTAPYVGVMDALQKAGVEDPRNATTSMKSSDVVVAIEQGAADAAWLSEPNASLAIEQGVAVPWKSAYDIAPKEQDAAIFYRTDWAKENPGLAQNFMNAYVCGVNAFLEGVAAGGEELTKVQQTVADYTETDIDVVEKAHLPGYFEGAVPDTDSIEHTVQLFVAAGASPKALSLDEMVNLDYVHEAANASCE